MTTARCPSTPKTKDPPSEPPKLERGKRNSILLNHQQVTDLGRRLELTFASVEEDPSLNPPATRR